MAVGQTGMCDYLVVQIRHQHFTATSTTCPVVEGDVNCFWLHTMQAEAFLVKGLLSCCSLLLFSKPVILTLIFSINLIVNWIKCLHERFVCCFLFTVYCASYSLSNCFFTYTVWCFQQKWDLNTFPLEHTARDISTHKTRGSLWVYICHQNRFLMHLKRLLLAHK